MKDNPSMDYVDTTNIPAASMIREVTGVFPSAESEAIVNSFLKHLVSLLPNPALFECAMEKHIPHFWRVL